MGMSGPMWILPVEDDAESELVPRGSRLAFFQGHWRSLRNPTSGVLTSVRITKDIENDEVSNAFGSGHSAQTLSTILWARIHDGGYNGDSP